jgi:ketosteroid isomerase-like protein
MSQENVELVRRATKAFNRRDLDAFVAFGSPDVVWEENPELPGLREIYHGQSGVREWMVDIFEVFRSSRVELDEITELSGGRVFTEAVLIASGQGSGVPLEFRFWQVLQWAEGKCARRQVFWNRDEALEAAGLRE